MIRLAPVVSGFAVAVGLLWSAPAASAPLTLLHVEGFEGKLAIAGVGGAPGFSILVSPAAGPSVFSYTLPPAGAYNVAVSADVEIQGDPVTVSISVADQPVFSGFLSSSGSLGSGLMFSFNGVVDAAFAALLSGIGISVPAPASGTILVSNVAFSGGTLSFDVSGSGHFDPVEDLLVSYVGGDGEEVLGLTIKGLKIVATAIPEPGTIGLLGLGAIGLLAAARQRRPAC